MAKQTRITPSEEPKVTSIPEIPIKVTVEIVVRHEYHAQPQKNLVTAAEAFVGGNCPDNKFSYVFEKENATVLSLAVEEFDKDNPGDSGNFTTCINDASPQPKVRIVGLAKENNPGGRVALTLKYLDKNFSTSPMEFSQAPGGLLKLNLLAKLPI